MQNHSTYIHFVGGTHGQWCVETITALVGEPLRQASHLHITPDTPQEQSPGIWTLTGFASNIRYAEKVERERLTAVQAGLGRPDATCAALIPIRKNAAWWALAQDERRNILEAQSHHIEIGLRYLPAIARKLYHCRDIGGEFDFLTWFEFAPEHVEAFDHLVSTLRQTEEWRFVERETDIRLVRAEAR